MRVGDLLGQHRDDRVAADIRATPSDLAVRIERDAISGGVASDEPGFTREDLTRVIRIGVCLGVFAAGDATDQPGATAELLVDTLEQPRHAVLRRPPPATPGPAVDARIHVADDIRLHRCPPFPGLEAAAPGSRAQRLRRAGSGRYAQP